MISWIKALLPSKSPLLSPKAAYQRWAAHYEGGDNLMHVLDRELVEASLGAIDLQGKTMLDFGCGTGRYWPYLQQKAVGALIGCDISPAMLDGLRERHPGAQAYEIKDHRMPFLENRSVDILFSTLAIGHFPELKPYFEEWNRVLGDNGWIFFTGNHPKVLKMGAERTFDLRGKRYRIRNYIHDLAAIRSTAQALGWREQSFRELSVETTHRGYFERKGALESFKRIRGRPVVYGMGWKKG